MDLGCSAQSPVAIRPTIKAAPITSAGRFSPRGASRHTRISHPRDDRQRLQSRRRCGPFPGGAAHCLEHFPLCRKVPRFPPPCCRAFSPLVGTWPCAIMSRNSLFDYSGSGLNFAAKTVRPSRALILAARTCPKPYSTAQIARPLIGSF